MKKYTLLFLAVLLGFTLTAQTTYYVNATGGIDTNDGKSWTASFSTLQKALDVAVSGDKVWVAKGTYVPSSIVVGTPESVDPRDKSFLIKNGISVYGGFVGTETTSYDLSLRDFVINKTVLSGDLDGTPANNAYHVVLLGANSASITLDGFTISDGNANGIGKYKVNWIEYERYQGAGAYIYCDGHNVNFLNNTVSNNASINIGGGMYVLSRRINGDVFLSKNTFSNNSTSTSGGGLYARATVGNLYISDNTVSDNTSTSYGAGMYLYSSDNIVGSISLSNNLISNNSSSSNGGGVFVNATLGTINVSNNTVYANTSTNGAGLYIETSASADAKVFVSENTVSNNSSSSNAGGLYAKAYIGEIKVLNNTISDNESNNYGGGMFIETSANANANVFVSENDISNNSSSSNGGGMYANNNLGIINISNNNVSNNQCLTAYAGGGGGLFINSANAGSITFVSKNIISKNTSPGHGGGLNANATLGTTYISNNLIYNNSTTTGNGFGCFINRKNNVYFVNNTVANNSYLGTSGAVGGLTIYNQDFATGSVYVYNSILYGNKGDKDAVKNIYLQDNDYTNIVDIKNCLIGGGYTYTGTNGTVTVSDIMDSNPVFVNAANNFSLTSGSPAINAGDDNLYNTTLYGSTDLKGNNRFLQTSIDLGAYEVFDVSVSIGSKPLENSISCKKSTNGITVSGLKGTETVTLYNMNGKQLMSIKASVSESTIPTISLSKGIYILSISSTGEGSSNFKLAL